MRDDDHIVLRHRHVHLQGVHTLLDGVLESGNGVFRSPGPRAAVTMHQNSGLAGCLGQQGDGTKRRKHDAVQQCS